MNCANCGTALPAADRPCPACGTPGPAQPHPDSPYPEMRAAAPSPWAIWSIVLGAASFLVCPIVAPFAIWTGSTALRLEPHARGLAIVGIVLGCLMSAALLVFVIFVGLVVAGAIAWGSAAGATVWPQPWLF